jgi:hypothetical protein
MHTIGPACAFVQVLLAWALGQASTVVLTWLHGFVDVACAWGRATPATLRHGVLAGVTLADRPLTAEAKQRLEAKATPPGHGNAEATLFR